MSVTSLGHLTIRCAPDQLAPLRDYYCGVLGLQEGERPAFPFPGAWLYCAGKPIIHLAAMDGGTSPAGTGPVDHFAFDAYDVDAVRERMLAAGVPFFERPIPGYRLGQLFSRDPLGIKVEQTYATPAVDSEEEGRVAVNGTRLAVEAEGDGPPLLLLHGGAGSLRMFDRIVPALSGRYRVIRYDQRDCGASDDSPRAYGFDELADDAVAVLDALDVARAHVFGTSFGGLLAQALAARHPRRVDRMVLSSTWTLGVPFTRINPARSALRAEDRTPEKLANAFFAAPYLERNPDAPEFFRASAAGMPRARADLLQRDLAFDGASIGARTLVIGGQDDRIVPFERSRELGRSIAAAQVAPAMPGVGHVGVVEAPQAVADLVLAFCG